MSHHNRTRRRGFTLIELMVALAAGTIAIGALYYLSATANQTNASQMRLSETQMALRMASEQLRRDFGRAGYLSARQAINTVNQNCSAQQIFSEVPFQALTIVPDGSRTPPITNLVGTNATRVDSVQLVGNFATSEDYSLDEVIPGSPTLPVSIQSQSFRRSFGVTAAQWQVPFQDAFSAGRMVRVEDKIRGRYFYHIIASVGAPAPTVTLSQPPVACATDSNATLISPIMTVQYSVVPIDGTNTAVALRGLDSTLPGGRRMALVRTELNMRTGAAIPGSERVVLDYVTEFRVDGVIMPAPGVFQEVNTVSAPPVALAPPDQFRSAVVTLAARDAIPDRRLTNIGRVNDAMVSFGVREGADTSTARVRTLRTEIFMYNLLRQ